MFISARERVPIAARRGPRRNTGPAVATAGGDDTGSVEGSRLCGSEPWGKAGVCACPAAVTEGLGTARTYLQTNLERSAPHPCPTCQSDYGVRTITDASGRFTGRLPDPRHDHFLTAPRRASSTRGRKRITPGRRRSSCRKH